MNFVSRCFSFSSSSSSSTLFSLRLLIKIYATSNDNELLYFVLSRLVSSCPVLTIVSMILMSPRHGAYRALMKTMRRANLKESNQIKLYSCHVSGDGSNCSSSDDDARTNNSNQTSEHLNVHSVYVWLRFIHSFVIQCVYSMFRQQ